MQFKKINELKKPFNDAVNYKSKDDKMFFSRIFLKTADVSKIIEPSKYYIIGEKGSGKTAYATYLENNSESGGHYKTVTMTETQYKRFIKLKENGLLEYSDYANIWRAILLLVISQSIVNKNKTFLTSLTGKFKKLEATINQHNKNSLNPEIESAFEILNKMNTEVEIGDGTFSKIRSSEANEQNEKTTKIRHHLLNSENEFKSALSELKIPNNHTIFIDGIDYRPEGVYYHEYIECIKGLAEAIWQLNTEFFSQIKDRKGRLKIALLVRPDIFHKLNIYNSNSRLHDNSVLLDWTTTETEYQSSQLYNISGRYFGEQQQERIEYNSAWNQYFGSADAQETFKKILKSSFQKPRDVLTFIKINIEQHEKSNKSNNTSFDREIVNSIAVTREFSDYLLGEVKNYASFYMKQKDFTTYLKFFQYLDGKPTFTVDDFNKAYEKFKGWALGEEIAAKEYLHDYQNLLQFFYDVNIIGYKEEFADQRGKFFHWASKDRTINNIYPKVKEGASKLMINQGIAKSLDIGIKTTTNEVSPPRQPRVNTRNRTRQQFAPKQRKTV